MEGTDKTENKGIKLGGLKLKPLIGVKRSSPNYEKVEKVKTERKGKKVKVELKPYWQYRRVQWDGQTVILLYADIVFDRACVMSDTAVKRWVSLKEIVIT